MATNNRNRLEVPQARKALEQLKIEVATELGIPDYEKLDKGDLPARIHGKVGGNMVRKLISFAQAEMAKDNGVGQQVAASNGVNEADKATVQAYNQ